MQKRKRMSRSAFWFLALAAVFLIGAGGTYAWTAHQASVQNDLQSRTVEVVIEEPGANIWSVINNGIAPKPVQFKNTGNAPVFLRVAYAETLTEVSHTEITDVFWKPLTTEFKKNWTAAWTSQWVDGGDGWYYYKFVLAPDATTDQILSTLEYTGDKGELGRADYNLDFMVEAVQVSDEAAVNTAATQAAFGKTGTVTGMTVHPITGSVTAGSVSWS